MLEKPLHSVFAEKTDTKAVRKNQYIGRKKYPELLWLRIFHNRLGSVAVHRDLFHIHNAQVLMNASVICPSDHSITIFLQFVQGFLP